MRHILGCLSVVTLLGAVLAPEAEACSPAICETDTAPWSGETIPHNAPALAIFPGHRPGLPSGLDEGSVQLLSEGGAPVEFVLQPEEGGRYLVRPDALQEGQTYQLSFRHPCSSPPTESDGGEVILPKAVPSSTAYPERVQIAFQAGAAAPLPQVLGTLSVATAAQVVQAGSYCGSCTAPLAAAVAQLQFTPSAELVPFLPVTRLQVRVDGQPWAESDYGSGFVEQAAYPGGPVRSVRTVFASCGTHDAAIYDFGVAPGRRVIEVRAHIAGAHFDPALLTVEVDLDCAPWKAMSPPTGSCGIQAVDAGSTDGVDGGTGTEPPSGGCSGGGWFGVGTLLIAVAFRQRRVAR